MKVFHLFDFSPNENGGEALALTTEFHHNGDDPTRDSSYYTDQELTLQSYGNSATFNLCGIQITPALLRQCADEMEAAQAKYKGELCQLNCHVADK